MIGFLVGGGRFFLESEALAPKKIVLLSFDSGVNTPIP